MRRRELLQKTMSAKKNKNKRSSKLHSKAIKYRSEKRMPAIEVDSSGNISELPPMADPNDDGSLYVPDEGEGGRCRISKKPCDSYVCYIDGCYIRTYEYECKESYLEREFRQNLSELWMPNSILLETPVEPATYSREPHGREPRTQDSHEERGCVFFSHYNFLEWVRKCLPDYFPDGKVHSRIQLYAKDAMEQGSSLAELAWLDLVVLMRPFWIRHPESWNGESKESLIRHLFVCRDIPEFLIEQWTDFQAAEREHFEWQMWLIIFGQGVEPCSQHPRFTKALKKNLFLIPWRKLNKSQQTTAAALMAAEIKRLGGADRLVQQFARNDAFVKNPVTMTRPFYDFFADTVLWLQKHIGAFSESEVDDLLAWAVHMHTERLKDLIDAVCKGHGNFNAMEDIIYSETNWKPYRKNSRLFRWHGRTIKSVKAASRRYHQNLYAIAATRADWKNWCSTIEWNALGVNSELKSKQGKWTIVELCSLGDLVAEGLKLSHCVATYAGSCSAGSSRIFSFSLNDNRTLTVELNCVSWQVNQVRGKANREPCPEEMAIVKRWENFIQQRVQIGDLSTA